MARKKKTDQQPEFSPEDIIKFMEWLAKQDQVIRDVLELDPGIAVKIIRNMKNRRDDPMDGNLGPNVGMLYAAPF